MSLRCVLGMVAAAAGCFVCVDRSGGLCLRGVCAGTEHALGPEDYLRLERSDACYGPVDALAVVFADGGERLYYADANQSALHVLRVEGNPLLRADAPGLDALARGMLDCAAGYYSERGSLTWRGDPELRIGDRLALTDASGRAFTGIVSRQSLRFDRSFQAECACVLPEKADSGVRRAITPEGGLNAAALTGAINGNLLSVGSVTTNKLSAGAVTAEKLAAGAVDAGAVSALSAKIGALTASDIETDSLAAALAAFTVICAGTAEFDCASAQNLVAKLFNLTGEAVMEEVFIHNLRIAYAQMVSASVGSLCIRAADGNYYTLSVDDQGRVTAVPATVSEGEISAGQTGDGKAILETGITADSLNTSSLLATHALINRIDAARIDVDELFAREATVAALNTADISSNTHIQQSIRDNVTGEIGQYVRLDGDGLHVGEKGAPGEVLIDEESVNVAFNGRRYSQFGVNHVQFGKTQLRGASDGGMLFRPVQEV